MDGDTIATLVGVGFVLFVFVGFLFKAFIKKYPCCPHCREIIDEKASRCPHCTSELRPTQKQVSSEIRQRRKKDLKNGFIDNDGNELGSHEYHLKRAMRIVKEASKKNLSQNNTNPTAPN